MAIGDDAAAAGMDVVSPLTDLVMDGADEITKTRDYLAQRTSAVTPVVKGGTGATNAADARTNLAAASAVHTHRITDIYTSDGSQQYGPALQSVLDDKPSRAQLQAVIDGNMSPAIFSRPVSGNSVYIDSGGVLGHLPSARRFKKAIVDANLDPAAIRQVLIRCYEYQAKYAIAGGPHIGVIAEEVEALGFGWLVGYDEQKRPLTVRYEFVGLLALALAQHEAERADDLEQRIAKLEELTKGGAA
ncbi:tail fiber domain-containing protein [Agromyces laixinhei]|uniref:tail fiber domain-containing protein n=1 Tax=Agromyces laixinhei TaxID=2585717 RepID=UPI0012EE1903|nr:tail fiber domain-containing protein [Agromyces laixinhei]